MECILSCHLYPIVYKAKWNYEANWKAFSGKESSQLTARLHIEQSFIANYAQGCLKYILRFGAACNITY